MIRKLTTWQEWMESDRIIATAFLHEWDEKKSEEAFKAQASGEKERKEEAWGLFDDTGKMTSTIVTEPRRLTFEGAEIACDEVHMVGSLPEARGGGSIRSLMGELLRTMKAKGDPFAVLIPFSFAFYRKFGFELAASSMSQKIQIEQFQPFICTYRVKQVASQEDANAVRELYQAWSLSGNLASVKEDKDWLYHGNGEFGERDWWFGNKQRYTYLFYEGDTAKAYLKFVFKEGPSGPFTGSMEVIDIAFTDPEALRNVFGFIYGMRAKITEVKLDLPTEIDLSLMMPECDKVERKMGGHTMARVLNVEAVLGQMKHPAGQGTYRIHIDDKFLPENTGTYEVCYEDGRAVRVNRTDEAADMTVTVETFCQLAIGLVDLQAALYRTGTRILGNEEVLRQVFVRKRILTD